MCIKKSNWLNVDNSLSESKDPVFGEICEVVKVEERNNNQYYELENYFPLYNVEGFAPISDIDETELAKEREQLQTV